jgi:hypothetical protein
MCKQITEKGFVLWIVGYTFTVNVMQCFDSFKMHVTMTMVPAST